MHGKMTKYGGGRYCDKHGEHGFLYICEEYPEELREDLNMRGKAFSELLKFGKVEFITNN